MEWKEVFTAATKKAQELRAKDPKLTQTEAVKKAWKDPRILKMKEDYQKNKTPAKPKKRRTTKVH